MKTCKKINGYDFGCLSLVHIIPGHYICMYILSSFAEVFKYSHLVIGYNLSTFGDINFLTIG